MARRALILVGDSTSHGGVVLEGADTDTLNGRAIACVGHRVSCPKCRERRRRARGFAGSACVTRPSTGR